MTSRVPADSVAAVSPTMTVAEIVAHYPATAPVFARHGVDLCCGGAKTLTVVSAAHGIPLDRLLQELSSAAAEPA